MLFNKSLNPMDLDSLESTAALQADRIEPELGEVVVALHVDMRWLIPVTSIEEEAIRAKSQHRGYKATYLTAAGNDNLVPAPLTGPTLRLAPASTQGNTRGRWLRKGNTRGRWLRKSRSSMRFRNESNQRPRV